MMISKIVTRFPPSPTGFFHIGSARTALFNYLFAKKGGGDMYLRFEDTDRERSKKEYEDDIIEGLGWLQIPYTLPKVPRQSERVNIYQKYVKKMLDEDLAYEAESSTDNPQKHVIRFRNPHVEVTFDDLIRGPVSFNTTELGDFIIAKGADEPLYHLAVVIDDFEMGVTHVIRGEDHISNTPRQILILEALGFPRPLYAHMPLILAPDKSKLSKRHGAVSVNEYRTLGYLPEAILNYLALLGWNPGDDRELLTLDEIEEEFDISRVHKSGAVFDTEKLNWFNRQYLLKMPERDFAKEALTIVQNELETRSLIWDESRGESILPIIRERISLWNDLKKMCTEGELDFFFTDPALDATKLTNKNQSAQDASDHLSRAREIFAIMKDSEFTDSATLKDALWTYATEHGRGNVLWPLRYALSGRDRSPDPFAIAAIIGKTSTQERINRAILKLNER